MSYSDHRSRDYERDRNHYKSSSSNHHHNNSNNNNHHHHSSTSHHHSSSRSNANNNNNNNSSNGNNSSSNYPIFDERDKFAGDYVSICLKNLNDSLTDTELNDAIYREFRKFGNFNVKVVYDRNMTRDRRAERIAFVNFDTHEQAKDAKRSKLNITFHGLPLYIEPVFRNRSNAPPPPLHQDRHYSSSDYHHRSGARSNNRISTPPLPPSSKSSRNKSRSLSQGSTNSRNSSISRSPESPRRRRRSLSRGQQQQHSINSKLRSPPLPPTRSTKRRSRSNNSRSRSRSRNSIPSPPSQSRSLKSRKTRVSSPTQVPPSRRGQHYQRDLYMSPPPPPPPPPPYRHHQAPLPPSYSHRHPYPPRHDYDHPYKPELNDKDATRTLFIGNLDPDVSENELRKLFERFGYIEEIDIKKIPNKKPYAFIKYINLDMAFNAKMEMNDKLIGKFEIKIGFGKLQPTNCLWIGGLNPRTKKTNLEKYFGYYGKIREIDWTPGDQYAYILYDNINDAEDARNNLNEKPLPNGYSDELRIDYGDPKRFDSNLDHVDSRSRTRTRSRSMTRSRSRSITKSNSLSRSRTRSRTQSKSITRSHSGSKSPQHHSRSPSPHPPLPSSHKRSSHVYDNGNDEKAYKKQRISSSLSRKIKTPPLNDDYENRRSQSPSNINSKTHYRRKHHKNHQEQENDPENDVEFKSQQGLENINIKENNLIDSQTNFEMKEENELLIKETLINKESQLSRIININDINTTMKHTWNGVFTLKKIAFPTKFYLLAGSKNLAEELLPLNSNISSSSSINITNLPSLRITQRLRLDPIKVEELEKKLYDSNYQQNNVDNCQFSVLIALPHELETNKQKSNDDNNSDIGTVAADDGSVTTSSLQQRALHQLIVYLNQKSAAGVIPLPDDDRPIAIVHAFPPNCQFSIKLLTQLLPNFNYDSITQSNNNSNSNVNNALNSDYLIIVLLKN